MCLGVFVFFHPVLAFWVACRAQSEFTVLICDTLEEFLLITPESNETFGSACRRF